MMRSRLTLAGAGLLALIIGSFAAAVPAYADVNNFTVTSFKADETLSRADPQGELRIVERINVKFTDYNHGILRAIPDSYKHHSLQLKVNRVSSDSGAPAQYTTYGSNGNTVLKIGDPDRTITGVQEYTVDYTLRNVISFYNDHDELYWDINGDQWSQPFDKVAATLHLPPGLELARKPVCYAGGYGATARDCIVSASGRTIKSSAGPLLPRHTLTVVAGFKSGYFRPSKWYETVGEYGKQIAAVVVPVVLLGGGSFLYWWREGRDPKGRGVIVPQYDPPDGLKPLQVDGLVDFKAGTTGITATIINLAIRGYIRIIETKHDKKLRKDTVSYSLQLLNTDFSALGPDEQVLMKALFDAPMKDEIVDVTEQKNKLYKTVDTLQKNVKQELKDQGYLRSKTPVGINKGGRQVRLFAIQVFVGVATLAFLSTWTGTFIILGLALGLIIGVAFLLALDARTAKGVDAKEHAEGLKMYLEVAEKDRLKKLQGPDAAYAPKSAEPKKTVELFEKLLPYAMVLGVEKQWAGKFKDMYTTPPDWYSGNWTTFNAAYLATSLNSGVGSAVDGAFSAPSSSGSSGFGGGFSGGGGGGGGGGGW
jgi:uncharacterized membrane protein